MTLQEILINSSAYLDQNIDVPTGDDLDTRVNYANMRVREWEKAYKFNELKTKYIFTASTLASVSMPSNFSEIAGNPQELLDGNNNWQEHTQVDPSYVYDQTNDYFCYLLGSKYQGYNMVFNKLSVGATMSVDYFRTAATLATLTDICEVTDCNYVVQGVIASVLQARGDDRFPIVEAKAQQLLSGMIGENQSSANSSTRAPKKSYHLGRR